VTELVAVAALNVGHVARFGAVAGHVTLLTAVAATTAAAALGAVPGEVSHW
jgi:hypothetical protein